MSRQQIKERSAQKRELARKRKAELEKEIREKLNKEHQEIILKNKQLTIPDMEGMLERFLREERNASTAQPAEAPTMAQNPDVTVLGPQAGPQTAFLSSPADIVFYGGSAGGGKTYGLLLDPLRYVQYPKFGAVIFRRTYPEIKNEGGLWDESTNLYLPLGARPKETDLSWTFPSGCVISFAHLQHEKNIYSLAGRSGSVHWV